MECRTYRNLYPIASLEAVGVLGKGLKFDSFFVSDEESAKRLSSNYTKSELGYIIGELPNDITLKTIESLSKVPKPINEMYCETLRDHVELSEMNNIFMSFRDSIDKDKLDDFYSIRMPDPYVHLDYIKDALNTSRNNCKELEELTDEIMVEATTNEPLYKDPIMNIMTLEPEVVNGELKLEYLVTIPLIKGRGGETRFVSYKITLVR